VIYGFSSIPEGAAGECLLQTQEAPPCTKCIFGPLLILVILTNTARRKNVVREMERGYGMRETKMKGKM
jgi:hypothetical protein